MNKPFPPYFRYTALTIALLAPLSATAHKGWLLPSKTVLNVGQWVTFDAGTASDPFVKDHNAMKLDNLVVTAPDGSAIEPQNASTGKLRSTFDLQLSQPGTYKIAVLNTGINASWDDADGKTQRWPPRGTAFTQEGFASEVPAKAKNLKVTQSIGRLETFVTAGAPNDAALKPSGRGLELVPVTAFNDLYVGEPATFQLLLDGKPAADVKAELIADGVRYRDAPGEVELVSDKQGKLKIEWPGPGLYWFSATVEDKKAEKPARDRRSSYVATFEVLSP